MSIAVLVGIAVAVVLTLLLFVPGDVWRPEPFFVLTMWVALYFLAQGDMDRSRE